MTVRPSGAATWNRTCGRGSGVRSDQPSRKAAAAAATAAAHGSQRFQLVALATPAAAHVPACGFSSHSSRAMRASPMDWRRRDWSFCRHRCDQVPDPLRDVGGELVDLRLLVDDRPQHVGHRLPVEGLAAPQHLEEHAPEGPDVRPPVHRLAPGLLRRHVPRRPQEHPGLGAPGRESGGLGPVLTRAARQRMDPHGLGEPEVEDLDVAVLGDHDVAGLQVAVDDALLVGDLEGLGDLPGDA